MVQVVLGVAVVLLGLGVLVAMRRRFAAAQGQYDRWLPARGRVVAQEGVDFSGQPQPWQNPKAIVDRSAHAGVRQSGSSASLEPGRLTVEFRTIDDDAVTGFATNGRPSRGYDLGVDVNVLYNPQNPAEFFQLDGPGRCLGGVGVSSTDIVLWCVGGLLVAGGVGLALGGL